MINAYSTLANDGRMMRPYLVDRIVSPSGETVFQARPEVIGRPVRPEVARVVREMLTGVTEEGGTGKRAAVPGFSIGGKTGTAQKAVPGGYSSTDYYASFVGFVPAGEPVFSVLVSVERPRPQHTGGFVSAPVFGKIAAATARYLALDPDLPSDEEDGLDVAQP
jgi:cell division protein FtsI/penicillin-binding protein 2